MFQAQRRIFSTFKRHKAVSAENLYRHLPFEESNRERVDVAESLRNPWPCRIRQKERTKRRGGGCGGGWVNISERFPVALARARIEFVKLKAASLR